MEKDEFDKIAERYFSKSVGEAEPDANCAEISSLMDGADD